MPRAKDPVLTERQINSTSIVELRKSYRALVAHYRDKKQELAYARMANTKTKINRETAVKKVTEKYEQTLAAVRARRDIRIDKLSWKLFKKKQNVYVLRRNLSKRLAPVKDARAKNRREIAKKARALGYLSGVKKRSRIREAALYRAGYKEGQKDYRYKVERTRRGVVNRSASVDSLARTALLISRLSKALRLPGEYVALFVWAGEYESFFFYELKAALEEVGETLFYHKVYYLKRKGYIQRISQSKAGAIWALTPLGREIYNRVKVFLQKHIKVKRYEGAEPVPCRTGD